MFADAVCHNVFPCFYGPNKVIIIIINKSRQERLRMPEQRADEKQVIELKIHTEQRIKVLSDAYEIVTRKTYIEL